MIPDFSGTYIKADEVHDGDLLEILDEGKVEFSKALGKDLFNLSVRLNGDKVKIWSPSNQHGKILQQVFGLDSKLWIGKKVVLMIVQDKMLIKPLVETKV